MNDNRNLYDNVPKLFRPLLYLPVPWVYVLAYFIGVGLEKLFPVELPAAQFLPVSRIIGGVLFLIGGALAIWGLITFYKARTTTIPGKSSKTLVIWGPYRFSRNPMYVGLTLAYIGEAGLLTQVWPLVVLLITVAYINWIVIPVEEGRLKEDFQDEYERYSARVRRWL